MKKLLIILLVLLISSIGVMAEEEEGEKVISNDHDNQTLEIEETIPWGYTWSIPSKLTFTGGACDATVKVYSVHLPQHLSLNVYVSEENSVLTMNNGQKDGPILSLLDNENQELNLNNPILSVKSCQEASACSTDHVEETIKVKMTTHPFQTNGTYAGHITFSAKIEQ